VVWTLLAETGIRQSTLYAFDLDDYDAQERYIEAVNREETGTRLKNGSAGERELSISRDAGKVLDGYIQANRKKVTDEHGRDHSSRRETDASRRAPSVSTCTAGRAPAP